MSHQLVQTPVLHETAPSTEQEAVCKGVDNHMLQELACLN